MEWNKVKICTDKAGIESICARLLLLNLGGFEIEDNQEFLEFLEENRSAWDYVDEELLSEKEGDYSVSVYLPSNMSGREMLTALYGALEELKKQGVTIDSVDIDSMNEEDWEESWKRFFKPMEIGERVLIQPEWEPLKPTDRVVFTINPGMSFGTGGHATTRLCIRAIENYIKTGDRVLDLGSGSGILSIIALLLGADNATAVDIDENSVNIAKNNAKINGVLEKYEVLCGNILEDSTLRNKFECEKANIVLANIVADVIIPLSQFVGDFLKEDGWFIASGIIESRADEVLSEIEKRFEIVEKQLDEEWVMVVCKLKTPS